MKQIVIKLTKIVTCHCGYNDMINAPGKHAKPRHLTLCFQTDALPKLGFVFKPRLIPLRIMGMIRFINNLIPHLFAKHCCAALGHLTIIGLCFSLSA